MAQQKKRGPGRPPGSKNKKKSSNNKNSGNGNARATAASRRAAEMEAQNDAKAMIRDEIIGVIIIAIGAFLVIALQTKYAGAAGTGISSGLKGCFGFTAFILPYFLIVYGLLLFLGKTIHIGIKAILLLIVIFFMIALINAGRYMDPAAGLDNFHGVTDSFKEGIALDGGGLFGMSLGSLLVSWIGVPGLYILTFVIIFICLLLLINTPVSRFFEGIQRARRRKALEAEARIIAQEEEVEAARQERARMKEEAEKAGGVSRPDRVINLMTDEEPGESGVKGKRVRKKKPIAETRFEPAEVKEKEKKEKKPKTEIKQAEPEKTDNKPEEKLTNKEAADSTLDKAEFNAETVGENYEFPSTELLKRGKRSASNRAETEKELLGKAQKLEETLASFGIAAHVTNVSQGPAVTRYEVHPESGVKVKGIKNLADDIALNMEAKSIRIEAPIPGKPAVGIEIENDRINMVTVREIIESNAFKTAESKISFAVGKDIAGKSIVADLKTMPHLLIAGSTGSGKSVCINSIITSILYKARPDEVKLVLIDPKVVELSNYNGIPHMLIPVVTEPAKAAAALNWAVAEMDDRYRKFAEISCRDLDSYNRKIQMKKYSVIDGEVQRPMPQVVIIIDELADLMMAAPSQVEDSICRLAQKARAAGMHLIVATQRPSVDVITGVIKANIPSRIAFAVSSQVDSRTILDMIGAEKLVGKGDMLFNPLGSGKPKRVQGAFISDSEVNDVIGFVKSQVEEAEYSEDVIERIERANIPDAEKGNNDMDDDLLPEAIDLVVGAGQASVSMLQRRFRIGYNRAARIIDMMEERQIIGPSEGSKPRRVLISEEDLQVMQDGASDVAEDE